MNDGLVVLSYDVNPEFLKLGERAVRVVDTSRIGMRGTYDSVIRLEFERLGLDPLCGETFSIDEGAVGGLDVFDEDLNGGRLSVGVRTRGWRDGPFHSPPKFLRVVD